MTYERKESFMDFNATGSSIVDWKRGVTTAAVCSSENYVRTEDESG